jgi:L-amino acid N-acyltransferase YncA
MIAIEKIQDQASELSGNALTIESRDGTPVTVRTPRPGDVGLIQEMHERISKESAYFRYLGPSKPRSEDLQRLCSMGRESGVVLVATVEKPQEQVVGVAYYQVDQNNPTTAEPAILVEDNYQGGGLGKKILFFLCQRADQNGLETFDSIIHPTNQRVLQLIADSGLNFRSKYRDGLREVRVWLTD